MANDQGAGLGLYPYKSPFGSIKTGLYKANTGKNIFRYQPVTLDTDGKVIVTPLSANGFVLGSVLGWLDSNAAGLPSTTTVLSTGAYLPAGTEAYVIVSDDCDQEYTVEADTGGGTLPAQSDAGATALLTYEDSTGSTVTGIANIRLDASDVAADTHGLVVLLRPDRNMNSDGTLNTTSAAYCKWVCKLVRPQFGQFAVSIGT